MRSVHIEKLIVLGLLLGVMTIPALAKPKDMLKIGILNEHLEDVGCEFMGKTDKNGAWPILITGVEGTKMRLNNELVEFELKSESKDGKVQTWTSKKDGYELMLNYGPPDKVGEGSMSFEKTRLTIKHKGQTKTIAAKGGCGC